MATKDPTRPRRPPTRFAQKYGVFKDMSRPDIVNALQGYKSGRTPVSPHRSDDSGRRRNWKHAIADYQKMINGGFPMEWTRALRAYIPTADADFADHWLKYELDNKIHPLIDGPQWETLNGCFKSYPPPLTGDGHDSFMIADNPIVWKALKPILQLTTLYLDNSDLWPWWDALLSDAGSDNKRTEPSPHIPGAENLFFKMRTPEQIHKQKVPVKDLLREMAGKWFFCFRSMYRDCSDGGPQDHHWWGITVTCGGPGKSSVTLATELISPLLKPDLTEPERIVMINFAARTLAHEISHAAVMHYEKRIDPRRRMMNRALSEPYFADEGWNEVGHSLENNVLKSHHRLIMSNNGLPLLVYDESFPYPGTHRDYEDTRYLPPGKALEPHTNVRKLVSLEWMRLFLHGDFWDYHVRRYGGDALIPDDPLAEQHVFWERGGNTGNIPPVTCIKDVAIRPDVKIRLDMSPGEQMVATTLNIRRTLHRLARERLGQVMNEGYGPGPNGGFLPIQPGMGQQTHQEPSGPQEPGVPQAQGTEQAQGGPQVEGQPPTAGPEGQEVPPQAPAPAPAREPRDPPTPTSDYELPDEPRMEIRASDVVSANKIASYLKYFRNSLGLHIVATCTEDGLWFHLYHLVKESSGVIITFEDWKIFLRMCNSADAMLSWNAESKVVHSLTSGWEAIPPSEPPVARPSYPEPTLSQPDLLRMIDLVRRYIFRCPDHMNPKSVTWHDEMRLVHQFHTMVDEDGLDLSVANFRSICLTYFSACWTTGPIGCLQWSAPTYFIKMLDAVLKYSVAAAETTDIGTILPNDIVRDTINIAFEGNGVYQDDYAFVVHTRGRLADNQTWWELALLQLLPDYFSVAMVNNVRQIIFSYKHTYTRERLDRRMTDEQQTAIYLFMHRYHEDQQAKRKIWPRELREIYNNYQQTEELKVHRPRLFLSCFDLPNKYCRINDAKQIEFAPAPEKPDPPTEGENAQGGNAQSGGGGSGQDPQGPAQGGGQQGGNQGGTLGGSQPQGGPQPQRGPQTQGGFQPQGGFQARGGFPAQIGSQVQGGSQAHMRFVAQGGQQPHGGFQAQGGQQPQGVFQAPGGFPAHAASQLPGGFQAQMRFLARGRLQAQGVQQPQGGFQAQGGFPVQGGSHVQGGFQAQMRRLAQGGQQPQEGFQAPVASPVHAVSQLPGGFQAQMRFLAQGGLQAQAVPQPQVGFQAPGGFQAQMRFLAQGGQQPQRNSPFRLLTREEQQILEERLQQQQQQHQYQQQLLQL